MQRIKEAATGREVVASEEREALEERFGYTIDAVGEITGVVLWAREVLSVRVSASLCRTELIVIASHMVVIAA